ncbi:MAG: hypothetical protein DBX36_02785 [Oscillospiraceae bacterium]|nr:MAG: hypothetical protein DBX36_02785 [Oscillospiraceae bacterium]
MVIHGGIFSRREFFIQIIKCIEVLKSIKIFKNKSFLYNLILTVKNTIASKKVRCLQNSDSVDFYGRHASLI